MSEEKEVVPETNGEEQKKEENNDNNDKEAMVEEPDAKESKDKEEKEDTDLEAEIIRQVEYYFGDVNLPRDRFLRDQTQLDDGWVPLEVLLTFNRLSKLSSDVVFIENALKKSKSGVLEVADKKVRRNPENPIPEMNEERRKEIASRTIYAKGFPKNSTLDEILRFFKKYDEVENIIMRRYLDPRTKARLFKGSIFATFKTKEQAEKFIESKDSVKYNDSNLLIMWQEEYGVLKQEERNNRHKKKEKVIKNEKPKLTSLPTGTVLYFEDGNENMTREEIKTAFTGVDKKFDVAFVDYKIGLTKGWVRFSQENAAKEFLKLLDNGGEIEIGKQKVILKLLEGDEEQEYLTKTLDEMSKRRKFQKTFKQKNRGGYRGRGDRKRRRDNDNEVAPPAKVKCDDS